MANRSRESGLAEIVEGGPSDSIISATTPASADAFRLVELDCDGDGCASGGDVSSLFLRRLNGAEI